MGRSEWLSSLVVIVMVTILAGNKKPIYAISRPATAGHCALLAHGFCTMQARMR
jgi:hypothetical protein